MFCIYQPHLTPYLAVTTHIQRNEFHCLHVQRIISQIALQFIVQHWCDVALQGQGSIVVVNIYEGNQ